MSLESLLSVLQRLNESVDTLAALGAELRLRRCVALDSRFRHLLREVVTAIDPALLDEIEPDQEAIGLAFIQASFRQAIELLDNPTREPGWTHQDPILLQAIGQGSRRVVHAIEQLAGQRPNLRNALEAPGVLLDIGTGVGWLAIEAARTWPGLRVVGIDIWEPALTLARKNVSDSGVEARVEFRRQDVRSLADRDAFSVAWLAGPFISGEIVDDALEGIARALVPGGWLIFGLFAPPQSPLGQALTALRTIRSGGYPWATSEVADRLRNLGFDEVEEFSPGPPVLMVLGRRPIASAFPRPGD